MKDLSEQLEELKQIEGFPDGKDEDILKLSDEPFFTACSNPYLEDFINPGHKKQKKDEYDKKPFIGDVKESKRDSISLAHKYSTKSPWKGIMYFLMHYTDPGDVVLDGFAGTGMTGVAAQMCQDPPSEMKEKLESRIDDVEYGPRRAVLNELSPTGAFISANFNSRVDPDKVKEEAEKIVENVREECEWMYKTKHSKDAEHTRKGKNASLSDYNEDEKVEGEIHHIVWSDVYGCPHCGKEFALWDVSLDWDKGQKMDEFECPECEAELDDNECEKAETTYYDDILQEERSRIKEKPVLINYSIGTDRFEKEPDEGDLELIEKVKDMEIPYWVPSNELPDGDNTRQPKRSHNLTHTHHFYTKRNLYVLSKLYDEINNYDGALRNKLLFIFTSQLTKSSKKAQVHVSNFFHGGGGWVTTVSGNLHIPSYRVETNVIQNFERRISKANAINKEENIDRDNARINLGSATSLDTIEENSIDYVFVDPPFGKNLMYSELNFFYDSWLKVRENNEEEAIVNDSQDKDVLEYENLMQNSFEEFYRVLKPNRWITVEFHNSNSKVWNSIQKAMNKAGFIIAQVGVLDKKSGSFMSNTSPGSVENDLIINAYKPEEKLEDNILEKSSEDKEAEFVREQLEHLPVRANIERKEKMLYSKMLAYFVENGLQVKYDSSEFYQLLDDNFVEKDGYWFLEDQVDKYRLWRQNLELEGGEVDENQQILVTDENSALNWLDSFLKEPKEYSEIYTSFQQIATMSEDDMPELKRLLDNNFILEDGKYRRPRTEEEKQKVRKERKKDLDKAFKDIVERAREGGTKIKEVRKEALIHGFTKWYQQEKYDEILEVADRLYKSTLESSGDIMDFVDIARIKSGEE